MQTVDLYQNLKYLLFILELTATTLREVLRRGMQDTLVLSHLSGSLGQNRCPTGRGAERCWNVLAFPAH